MAKLSMLVASTSQTVNIFIQNSSVTTGAGLTGLVFNSGSLVAYYALPKAAPVAITLATLASATAAYSSGGFFELDATNMPGLYRLDIPNAALASGRFVTIMLKGATNMAPVLLEIELTAVDNQSTAFGLSIAKTTNITGFNDIAATAIVSSGAITTSGGAVSTVSAVTGLTASNLDATISSRMATYTQPTGFLAATFPSGTVANTTNITAGTITTATNLTNAPTAGDFTATMKTSLNAATPAVTVSDKTGFSLSSAGIDAILDQTAGIETNRTLRQGLRLMLAAMAGKLSGAATASILIRDTNDSKNRISATVDSSGNRSAVTYDAS